MNTDNLSNKRHTLAHLLAAAVMELYPDTNRTIGPAIDNGFYYDFQFKKPISDKDLAKIEARMHELLPSWNSFISRELEADKAKKDFIQNPFKLELIDEIVSKGEPITFYKSGNYEDLCRGGHLENPAKDIDAESFKLSHLAGAYWRGDEKNEMLTRIYGLAFNSKAELEAYLSQLEEAKARDHKKLGKELDLFIFSDLVGAGLPLWTPKGTLLRNTLDEFVWELRRRYGYQKVEIPHITKKDLYEKSGHWDKFKDELFRITTREGHEFAMKPMNCPHHTQIYARKLWSYRELPQRYANSTACYRDEQSGELSGLSRVRAFTQDDAHVFCRQSQAKAEFLKVWDIVHGFYQAFGFVMRIRLSLHDPAQPEKYLGTPERWAQAEEMLREIASEKEAETFDGVGEAAFYGPKLDFMAKDSLGREWQVATIQLDMNMPERFDLYCINEKGEQERIVMVHAAIMGSIERFLSIIIEHFAGAFPTWLAPVQVKIVPVSEKHLGYGAKIFRDLEAVGVRAELDESNESVGKKVRNAKLEKIPYFLVVGDKEIENENVTVEHRDKGKLGEQSITEFISQIGEEIRNRSL